MFSGEDSKRSWTAASQNRSVIFSAIVVFLIYFGPRLVCTHSFLNDISEVVHFNEKIICDDTRKFFCSVGRLLTTFL